MPVSRSHNLLVVFENENKYTTTQIFDAYCHTFPKGNIQIKNRIDHKYIQDSSNHLSSEHLHFCGTCGAIKETHINKDNHEKWFCNYCQDANYLSEDRFDDVVKDNFISDITSIKDAELTNLNLIILDLCLRDDHDREYVKFFLESLVNKTLANSTELINFVIILPDNNFLTFNNMNLKKFDHRSDVDFINNAFNINQFPWELFNQLIDNVKVTETGSHRCKREFPMELLYSKFQNLSNTFVKLLFHQLGPVTSKQGKIVNSGKKHFVRKFDDNKYNRESYKLSKKAAKYYTEQSTRFCFLQKKQNFFINMALFGCSLDDIGVMELSSIFKVYNFVDDYSTFLNKEKLNFSLQKWYEEDILKLIEFESFSTSDLFNIAGIWGDSVNFEKVGKTDRNLNKKPIDDLYVKNLVKTDNCRVLACNSLFNTLNLSYTIKLIRNALDKEDGVLTEEMLQLKHGSNRRSINVYPDRIKIQNITKFINKGRYYLQKHALNFPVIKDVTENIGYKIDHSMLFNSILTKFTMTNYNLIRNDIHNITMFMESYQNTLTSQLINNYMKMDFLKAIDVDIEKLLLGFYNMKYTLPIANVVQMTPDEYFMNISKIINNSIYDNMLEIYPKNHYNGDLLTSIELSDIVYILDKNATDFAKPKLEVNNDSTRRHVSNKTNFTVLNDKHEVVMDYEIFKSTIINKAFK